MNFKLHDFEIEVNVKRIAALHYFEFTNSYTTKCDSHNFYELLYIDRGSINVISDEFNGTVGVNELIIHKPLENHSLSIANDIAPNVIIIGFECEGVALETFSKNPVHINSELANLLAKTVQEGMSVFMPPYDIPNREFMPKRQEYPFGADQMVKICLEHFLIALVREYSKKTLSVESKVYPKEGIHAVHKYISENFKTKLSLDNICFLFGFNKTTLCKRFKEEYGITILNFITKLKIKESKALLRENEHSVTEISEMLGFDSVHYFCRYFKKYTGGSPTEYVKSIRSKLNL